MAEVQFNSVPILASDHQSQSVDKDALIARLDELLETYLHTIDRYQRTREQLSKQLSSGFLSLAQANFQNRSGTHYGQDNYDERMQAIRKVFVQADDSATSEDGSSLSIVSEQDIAASTKEPSSKDSKDETADYDEPSQSPEEGKKVAKSVDPLRWFGILVPPALRSTQSSFIAAIEGPIPQLANISRELRSQEIEIGRVRKQIKKL